MCVPPYSPAVLPAVCAAELPGIAAPVRSCEEIRERASVRSAEPFGGGIHVRTSESCRGSPEQRLARLGLKHLSLRSQVGPPSFRRALVRQQIGKRRRTLQRSRSPLFLFPFFHLLCFPFFFNKCGASVLLHLITKIEKT